MEALDFVQRMVNFDRLMEGENRDSGDPDDIEHWCAVYAEDRKSTRLNSSHLVISYAVFCLKKKKKISRLTNLIVTEMHARLRLQHARCRAIFLTLIFASCRICRVLVLVIPSCER